MLNFDRDDPIGLGENGDLIPDPVNEHNEVIELECSDIHFDILFIVPPARPR